MAEAQLAARIVLRFPWLAILVTGRQFNQWLWSLTAFLSAMVTGVSLIGCVMFAQGTRDSAANAEAVGESALLWKILVPLSTAAAGAVVVLWKRANHIQDEAMRVEVENRKLFIDFIEKNSIRLAAQHSENIVRITKLEDVGEEILTAIKELRAAVVSGPHRIGG